LISKGKRRLAMLKKTVSGTTVFLLASNILGVTFGIQPVKQHGPFTFSPLENDDEK